MDAPATDYTIVSQVHQNKWDERLGRVVEGWEYRVLDLQTDTTIPVFVPASLRTPENVRVIIERELAPVREIHQLGR